MSNTLNQLETTNFYKLKKSFTFPTKNKESVSQIFRVKKFRKGFHMCVYVQYQNVFKRRFTESKLISFSGLDNSIYKVSYCFICQILFKKNTFTMNVGSIISKPLKNVYGEFSFLVNQY